MLDLMTDPRLTVPAANDGVTDDSAAINQAASIVRATGERIVAPAGAGYRFNSPLNFTNMPKGCMIVGDGSNGATRFLPGSAMGGLVGMDFVGTRPNLHGFSVVESGADVKLDVATLIAPMAGQGGIDRVQLTDVVTGIKTSKPALSMYGVTNSALYSCANWQFADDGWSFAAGFFRTNDCGLSSPHVQIGSGDLGGGSITCIDAEFHHMKYTSGYTQAMTLYLGSIVRFSMRGGNVAGCNGALICSQISNYPSGVRSSGRFDAVDFYADATGNAAIDATHQPTCIIGGGWDTTGQDIIIDSSCMTSLPKV